MEAYLMKLGIISDLHFGARNDSLLFNNYFLKFYHDVVFPNVLNQGITRIINLGDTTDRRKFINFNILNKVRHGFFDVLQNNNINMDVIIGNHDCTWKGSNSLNSVEELFGHYDNLKIYSNPNEIEIDGLKILILPWINQENYDKSIAMIEDSTASVVMGHLQLIGFEMNRGQPAHEGLNPDLFKKFDMVLTGHFHHKSNVDNIFYVGSGYQMTFSDYNDPRGFHILNTKTLELEFIQNPYNMFHKLYYDDKGKTLSEVYNSYNLDQYTNAYVKIIVTNKTNPYYFEQLVDKLYKVNPADVSVIEDLIVEDSGEELDFLESAEDTLSVLLKYVDALDYSGNKNKIKDMLRNLYIEANMMEVA
jgi:DNA repair exonuclease SbcCD nuclease subunit